MEPVSDNEGVASSGTPVAVAHTRPTTTRPVIANSSRAEVSDILSVAAVHSSSHSFRLWEGVSHSVGAWMYSCFFVRIEDLRFKMVVAGGYVEQVLHCQPQPKDVSCLAGNACACPVRAWGKPPEGAVILHSPV